MNAKALLLKLLLLLMLTPYGRVRAQQGGGQFDQIGRALIIMLGDTHFEPLQNPQALNQRILDLYLASLDPDRVYFTQKDVDEFTLLYILNPNTSFDILLLRSQGTRPAEQIYNRFATRVAERTIYVEKIADKAAFNFEGDFQIPLDRSNAAWPADQLDANRIISLRIAHEILAEQFIHQDFAGQNLPLEAPKQPQPAKPQNKPNQPDKLEANASPKPTTSLPIATHQPAPPQEALDPLEKTPVAAPAPKPSDLARFRKTVKTRYQRFEQTVLAASKEEIAGIFFTAVAEAHDPHSNYLNTRQNERFEKELKNQLTGIGAELVADADGATRVSGILVGGPAHRQGRLQPNDRIVAVDPLSNGNIVDITFWPIQRVVNIILGAKNTSVTLFIENKKPGDSKRRRIIINRAEIELKEAAASAELIKIAQSEGPPKKIGWISIPSFYLDYEDQDPSVYSDVKRLVSRLKQENVDGIALDLRGNVGGPLEEAHRLVGLFVARGPTLQEFGQKGLLPSRPPNPIRPAYDGPLAVLTDRESASSSEILAAALQDHNRAILVGAASTFGKGTVQQKTPIAEFLRFVQNPAKAGELKVTIRKFYRVSGSATQLRGVVPHIILPCLQDGQEIGERYLKHALPHDNIKPALGFKPLPFTDLFLPVISEKSRKRVQSSPEFQYIREDTFELLKDRRDNLVSLNRKKRLADIAAQHTKQTTRNTERKTRFARTNWIDSQKFHFLRLNLDDLERERLFTVDRKRDSNAIIIRASGSENSDSENPDWPSGLDPAKRETIAILEDAIQAKRDEAELNRLKEDVENLVTP